MTKGLPVAAVSTCPLLSAPVASGVRWQVVQRAARWYFCTWPLGVAALWLWSPWAALAHFLSTHTVAIYSALRSNSQLYGCVVQSFATTEKEVWLTIDDGPFPGDTAAMLEVLARHQVKATFFLEGKWAEQQPALVQRIAEQGHGLGNHSHTHRVSWFWATSPWGARRELRRCQDALEASAQTPAIGFRPPVGMANGFVHHAAREFGLPVVGWSARGYDGVDHCPERVAQRIGARLAPGAILLLHQRRGSLTEAPRNAETLDRVLGEIARHGYRCVLPQPHQLRTEPIRLPRNRRATRAVSPSMAPRGESPLTAGAR